MKQLHQTQLDILRKLVFAPGLKFSELKPDKEMDNNQFTFHVAKMMEAGLVIKESELYKLTNLGKDYANRLDTEQVKMKLQAKLSALVICTRQREELEFLIYTRLKHPFYGCHGFPTGKIEYGEQVVEAAQRELQEEAGLVGKPELIHIRHYRVFSEESRELLEDKFMFFCLVREPAGEISPDPTEGKYEWVAESKLQDYVTNHFESWEAFAREIKMVKEFTGQINLEEVDHYSVKY